MIHRETLQVRNIFIDLLDIIYNIISSKKDFNLNWAWNASLAQLAESTGGYFVSLEEKSLSLNDIDLVFSCLKSL